VKEHKTDGKRYQGTEITFGRLGNKIEGKRAKQYCHYIWKTIKGYGKLPDVYSQKASPPQKVCC
jgi:hypothetical protein